MSNNPEVSVSQLRDQNPTVRQHACIDLNREFLQQELVESEERRKVVDGLAERLYDPRETTEVKLEAIRSLQSHGCDAEAAVSALFHTVTGDDPELYFPAYNAIQEIGYDLDSLKEGLRASLDHYDSNPCLIVCNLIRAGEEAGLVTQDLFDDLIRGVEHNSPTIQQYCAERIPSALSASRFHETRERLIEAGLRTENYNALIAITTALKDIGIAISNYPDLQERLELMEENSPGPLQSDPEQTDRIRTAVELIDEIERDKNIVLEPETLQLLIETSRGELALNEHPLCEALARLSVVASDSDIQIGALNTLGDLTEHPEPTVKINALAMLRVLGRYAQSQLPRVELACDSGDPQVVVEADKARQALVGE